MSQMFVVRHGQASLFADDYDVLSELGVQQGRLLGEYWLQRDIVPDVLVSGSLVRQQQTATAVCDVLRAAGKPLPDLQINDGLNEYPAEEILRILVPIFSERDDEIRRMATEFEQAVEHGDRYRGLHRLLTAIISRWIDADYETAEPLQTWAAFSSGVRQAFRSIMSSAGSGTKVAVFTSGGPTALSVQTVLGAPDQAAAELNWRVHNGSVSRFTFSGERVSLDAFNDTAHLPMEYLTYR